MSGEPQVGLHISIEKSLDLAFDRAREVGCTTFQIFTRNPRTWKFKPLTEEQIGFFRAKRSESGVAKVVAHMPYLPNLASSDKATMKISRYTLDEEVKRCDALGIDYLVTHLGSHLGGGIMEGVRNVSDAVSRALAGSNGRTAILLENMAGQKNSVGSRFEELEMIVERVGSRDRVGVCLDTCLPPGSSVVSNGIPRPIETISVGDEVTDINGGPTRVTRLIRRPYSGELVWIKPESLPWLPLTPDHPLLYVKTDRLKYLEESPWRIKLTSDPSWILASEVRERNYLVMPKLISAVSSRIDFKRYIGANTRHLPFPAILPLTAELAEFFGLYLAEGFVYMGRGIRGDLCKVYLSFGKHEKDLIKKAIYLYEKIFSLKAWTDEKATAINVSVCSNILARFLRSNFGPNARKKWIPSFIMQAPEHIVRSFLLAYLKGDGCVDNRGIRFITSSNSVAIQLIHLLARIDIHGTFTKHGPTENEINGRVVRGQGWYVVHVGRADSRRLGFDYYLPTSPQRRVLRNKNSYYIPVRSVLRQNYAGEVINLTTESGSFLAPFVVTHNCHAFAAGFDFVGQEGVRSTMSVFEDCVGVDLLRVVHLNDSKGPIGSRLDRHENVGRGRIGSKGFRAFLRYPGVRDRPLIMETPYDDVKGMKRSVAFVRSLLR